LPSTSTASPAAESTRVLSAAPQPRKRLLDPSESIGVSCHSEFGRDFICFEWVSLVMEYSTSVLNISNQKSKVFNFWLIWNLDYFNLVLTWKHSTGMHSLFHVSRGSIWSRSLFASFPVLQASFHAKLFFIVNCSLMPQNKLLVHGSSEHI
jgi:hypothetical protein